MKTALFDYPLPERLIAQKPADRRDASRLLVVHRTERRIEHRHFRDLPEYLRAGDTLFRNNAAVIPARLHAQRPTAGNQGGGHVECLLLRPAVSNQLSAVSSPSSVLRPQSCDEWWCLLRPGKKLPVGATFGLEGQFTATVREKTGDGAARVAFRTTGGNILEVANRIGEMPLPPYIERHQEESERLFDRERYQTVYADRGHQVAAAAPTAGLHFTPDLLAQAEKLGVRFADLTLHVGLGTFRPIMSENIEDHDIHRETYEIPVAAQQALFAPPGRRIAVGTTSVRTIEDYLSNHAAPTARDFLGDAGIFIYPPRTFRGVDALITNFHQPRSTLLCLVSAFLAPGTTDGIAWLKEIYAEAVVREYRFFSYGDAMLII
ncbi:MAG TPA: tRNA preQ1(34) S-adenosylmethionine ribosyltransferase-isomerase QueA [Candidatus Didemnitutus sp.]|nr:tRNA preQ1(34) S-adenosylmethionine ribosyltransferase-isomerase QueA [Candidatus Didemnitutus sp.]